jgi:hypothetical protein
MRTLYIGMHETFLRKTQRALTVHPWRLCNTSRQAASDQ